MLSILIPTYNANCLLLIENVYKQVALLKIPFEIILADDASDENYRIQNSKINQYIGCKYLQLEENYGPAKIRNRLAEEACYEYLLFLDSDVMPVTDLFISNYINYAEKGKVICGGFVYKRNEVPDNAVLRYKYGIAIEEQTAQTRNLHPYHSFISMNFLICREAFLKIKFDETFHLGYEDTLFGIQLKNDNINIIHIDNPVYHCVEESSEQFLIKIKRAVSNLLGHEDTMRPYVKLLKWHYAIKKLGMQPLCAFIFKFSEAALVSNLQSKNPSLKLFAFYKLGYLSTLY